MAGRFPFPAHPLGVNDSFAGREKTRGKKKKKGFRPAQRPPEAIIFL